MKRYIAVNRNAYNVLAEEYDSRWKKYLKSSYPKLVLRPFENELRKNFKKSIRVLDVGCGAGLDSYIFSLHRFAVWGIDISPVMVAYAKKNSPRATIESGNFLHKKFSRRFHGIVMNASFHLFPKKDSHNVINRIKKLLCKGGLTLISTTAADVSKEGYFLKKDYRISVKRFRKFWRPEELIRVFTNNGFELLKSYGDKDPIVKKRWKNFIFRKI